MNTVTVFENSDFGKIRTMVIDGEAWFVGKDIADRLGYSDPQKAIKMHVDEDDKLTRQIVVSGQNRNVIIINESGLYSLVLSSKLPSAKAFKRWVTSEVLPSIRKHGAYMTPQTLTQALSTPENLIALLQTLQAEQNKTRQLAEEIEVMKPKATYYDTVLNCKELVPISVIAKDYGKSAIWLNRYLHEKKVQYRKGNIWLIYQKYANNGYASTKTDIITDNNRNPHVRQHLCWTQKGRLFIYELLKEDNILPLMEHETI